MSCSGRVSNLMDPLSSGTVTPGNNPCRSCLYPNLTPLQLLPSLIVYFESVQACRPFPVAPPVPQPFCELAHHSWSACSQSLGLLRAHSPCSEAAAWAKATVTHGKKKCGQPARIKAVRVCTVSARRGVCASLPK